MDIFQNQCSESLGFDSMLSSNHLNSPLHDSPGSPNQLTFAPSSPYFASISQQLCGSGTGGSSSGPNDVILPSIFVKIPTQINQQYQQENRLQNARNASEIKCEERAEPIKCEVADTRGKQTTASSISEQLPDIIDNYLNDTHGASGTVEAPSIRRCDCCPFATLSEASLGEHKRTKHPAGVRMLLDTLSCPVCENKFYKNPVLELHLLEDHEMTRNEVEMLCSKVANFQQNQTIVVSTQTQTSSTSTPTLATTAAPNRSRIYIKDVQLLKKPDVIAQETQHETVQQGQSQQLLSADQQSSHPATHLCSQENLLPPNDSSSHGQFQGEHGHLPPQPAANGSASGSKIFIRNVSLLQNVNFTPSAENILLSNGGKYHSFMNHECQSSLSPAIDTASMDDSYCQMLPSPVATQPRGNRIYIKNVDILRNPLLSLNPTQAASNSFDVTTTSRASSCESIICTTTPPPPAPQASTTSQTMPSIVQSTGTVLPLSQIVLPSQSHLATGGDQSLPGGGVLGLGGLMTPQQQQQQSQQQIIGQATASLPMMYATAPTPPSGLTHSCTSSASSVSPCISVVPSSSNASGHGYQVPSFASDVGQRKSKIFIKNISVLKQPTIHLKSVDEVNLMTYDQLQLQNLLPVGATPVSAGLGNDGLDGERRQEEQGLEGEDGGAMGTDQMNPSYGGLMDCVVAEHQQQQQQQHEEAMDGYHDVSCYGDLDVCDFTDGFNERDDPGGGGGSGGGGCAISVPSGGSNNNTLGMSCDGMLGDARCDNFQSGFGQDIILLQPSAGGAELQANETQKMSDSWPSVNIDGEPQANDTQKMSDSWPSVNIDGESPTNAVQKMADSWQTVQTVGGSSQSQDNLGPSESVSAPEGTMSVQHQDNEIMFVCSQEVINLDPPNEEPKVGEDIQMHAAIEGGQPGEPRTNFPTDETSSLANDRASERPRPRGRPKGAKQTGITKLKKLYSNLTPQEEGYKCDIKDCGARFRQTERLEYHRKCHLPEGGGAGTGELAGSPPAIQCPECGSLEFRNWNTLHTHLWREHGIDMELYSCQLCSFKTPVLCRLTNTHMKIHSEERNFKCAICSKAFKNNKQLRNHRRSHRDPGQTQPPPQQQQQQQQQELPPDEQGSSCDRMEVDEAPPEPVAPTKPSKAQTNKTPLVASIKCVKCGQKFTSQRQLQAHMDAKHPPTAGDGLASEAPGKHRCVLCGMKFRTRYLLQSHSAKHSDEKRFKCEHCDYTTNDHNAFRRHKMRHNTKGSHMYKCSYCDYTSIQSTTYRKHLERMHADEASRLLYKCARCPFVSISELKYQLHRAKHEEGEPGEEPVEETRRTEEQLTSECDLSMTEGASRLQEQQEDSRACESVGSDVMIVDNREPMDDTVDVHRPSTCGEEVSVQHTSNYPSGLQAVVQQPIIRPAMFANNFSKVDNFYGHHHQHQLQPKLLKLTDRIPAHRVSPLGQLQLQPQSLLPSVTLPGSAMSAASSLPVATPALAGVGFQISSFDMQKQYEHQQQQQQTQ
uniref:C2H2-type domain-containing protein n=1 Tax=Anopheles atroparvus TaxID=41427 RepID=A0AAG5DID4_ANOAO